MSSFVARGVHFMKHQVALTLDQRVAIASFAQWCDDNGLIGNETEAWEKRWKRVEVDGPPPAPVGAGSEYDVWAYRRGMPYPLMLPRLTVERRVFTHWAHTMTPPIPQDAM